MTANQVVITDVAGQFSLDRLPLHRNLTLEATSPGKRSNRPYFRLFRRVGPQPNGQVDSPS